MQININTILFVQESNLNETKIHIYLEIPWKLGCFCHLLQQILQICISAEANLRETISPLALMWSYPSLM